MNSIVQYTVTSKEQAPQKKQLNSEAKGKKKTGIFILFLPLWPFFLPAPSIDLKTLSHRIKSTQKIFSYKMTRRMPPIAGMINKEKQRQKHRHTLYLKLEFYIKISLQLLCRKYFKEKNFWKRFLQWIRQCSNRNKQWKQKVLELIGVGLSGLNKWVLGQRSVNCSVKPELQKGQSNDNM